MCVCVHERACAWVCIRASVGVGLHARVGVGDSHMRDVHSDACFGSRVATSGVGCARECVSIVGETLVTQCVWHLIGGASAALRVAADGNFGHLGVDSGVCELNSLAVVASRLFLKLICSV